MAGPVVSSQLVGDVRLERTSERAALAIGNMQPAHAAAGAVLVPRARQLTPRISGNLGAGNRAVVTGIGVDLVNDVIYAGPIHFGWAERNIEPQPWGPETLQDTQPAVEAVYDTYVERVLDTVEGV